MMLEPLHIIWFPTLRCNLKCGHCAARQLSVEAHGAELPAEVWQEVFAKCPREVAALISSGREPTIYPGVREVWESVDWPLKMETNLMVHPDTWYSDKIGEQLLNVKSCLHHHPLHKVAVNTYWPHLKWLREHLPPEVPIQTGIVMTQRELAEEGDIGEEKALECGVKGFKRGSFDESFMYKDMPPLKPPVKLCAAGLRKVVLMPDGTAYRCVGHTYWQQQPMGNVVTDGWGVLLEEPAPCDAVLCTACESPKNILDKKDA